MLIGYARTSTVDQVAGLEAQQAALAATGCSKVFSEQASSVGQRGQLAAVLDYVRDGDTLVVTRLDRLARSTADLLGIVATLETKQVALRILDFGGSEVDTRSPTGRMLLTMFAAVAEFERAIMLERQRASVARAWAEGKHKGRRMAHAIEPQAGEDPTVFARFNLNPAEFRKQKLIPKIPVLDRCDRRNGGFPRPARVGDEPGVGDAREHLRARQGHEHRIAFKRNLLSMPEDGLREQLRKSSPELDEAELDGVIAYMRETRDRDPLAALKEGLLNGTGCQFNLAKMAPNFEMALYIAQATGAAIVTDSPHRWREIQLAIARQGGGQPMRVPAFAKALATTPLGFVNDLDDFFRLAQTGAFEGYPALMRDAFRYLTQVDERGIKPNWEAGLAARTARLHQVSQARLSKEIASFSTGRLKGIFPIGGIQDNTVNRLLLMSSSEHHLPSVPMAFYIDGVGK